MVDIDPESPEKLRFVVSHSPTLASSMLIQVSYSSFAENICHVADQSADEKKCKSILQF